VRRNGEPGHVLREGDVGSDSRSCKMSVIHERNPIESFTGPFSSSSGGGRAKFWELLVFCHAPRRRADSPTL